MTKLSTDFNCTVCHRPMRKDVHIHKMKGGTVKIHRPKGYK